MKKGIRIIFNKLVRSLIRVKPGARLFQLFSALSMDIVEVVRHNNVELKLVCPNRFAFWRARSFSTKEPETLRWIDQFSENAVFYDIGANVGLYSLYAAKKNIKVYSAEPSVFNLELLARNIYNNQLVSGITILPVAISNENKESQLLMTSTDWSGALSTFGSDIGYDGGKIQSKFSLPTIGFTLDALIAALKLPLPDYLKIDVDGIEHFILEGSTDILRNVKEIHIEINDDFAKQEKVCRELLTKSGFMLRDKQRSDLFDGSDFSNSYNQTWVKQR
ncbi:FkbM family methyltransferase [Schleiferiaceae bacterium]|nr:FkbM family methyltransferase [Schleiferiaceae bacterium]